MCASTPVVTPRCGFNMLKEKRENGSAIVVRLSSFIIAVKGIRETGVVAYRYISLFLLLLSRSVCLFLRLLRCRPRGQRDVVLYGLAREPMMDGHEKSGGFGRRSVRIRTVLQYKEEGRLSI